MKLGLNIPGQERWIRVGAGLLLILLAFSSWLTGAAAMTAYVIGALMILTAAVGFCPAYSILGRGGKQPAD